jgi:hypothetical protein
MVLEGLVRNDFVVAEDGRFQLRSGFENFKHVAFYPLGDFRKRQQ